MIDSSVFPRLRAIGLAPAVVQQLAAQQPASLDAPVLMRVTEVQRESLTLHDGHTEHPGRMLPALRAQLAADSDALAVGDWVFAQRNEFGEWWAHQRLPPLNQLARRLHDGRDKVTRVVIVSNVDTALLVMGMDHDFSLRRLERYVALVRMAGVGAVVVLTKRDLCANAEVADARLSEVQAVLPAEVLAVALDAQGSEPAAALAPWLGAGQTLVLLGSSGAGKSTLTNSLTALHTQDTGANRAGDGRGRHTTTTRSLHALPQGGCIIDTPGLRTLRLDGDAEALSGVFDDIARLATHCRFRDCGHEAEPGCAVREGVSAERLRSFKKLLREARRDSITALERQATVQQWKARHREVRVRMSAKRG